MQHRLYRRFVGDRSIDNKPIVLFHGVSFQCKCSVRYCESVYLMLRISPSLRHSGLRWL
jgi:hypothetical protein